MTQRLGRLVQAAAGQPPSPEFVQRLRAQIVAETEGVGVEAERVGRGSASDGDPTLADPISDVFDLEPPADEERELATRRAWRKRRNRVLATAAAVTVVFTGAWLLVSADRDADRNLIDAVDSPSPTTAADPTDGEEVGSPLTAGNTFFDAGTFRIDTLGTAFSFSVEETTGLAVNENGVVSVTDLTSRNVDDRTITLRRTSELPDPSDPTAAIDPNSAWPADDLRGWLGAVGDVARAGELLDTTLGGLDATFVELEFLCPGEGCTPEALLPPPGFPMFTHGSRYRLWLVDQGSEDPIVVTVAIDDDDEATWFDEADAILATVVFESIEPNPVRRRPAGLAALDVFDGISVEFADEVVVVEPFEGFARILPPGFSADVELLTRPLDNDGVEVASTGRLLELLALEAVEVTELDSPDVGGVEARAFETASNPFAEVTLNARSADLVRTEFGWAAPQRGHLWILEHPDRGLLLVSAEALDGPDANASLRPWTEALLRTLEFEEG